MKNNFDDLLKKNLEQIHYPVDESHRQEMADLLDRENRRKPFPLVWWLGGLVVILAFAGLYFLMPGQKAEQKSEEPNTNELKITAPDKIEVIANAQIRKPSESNDGEGTIQEASTNSPSVTTDATTGLKISATATGSQNESSGKNQTKKTELISMESQKPTEANPFLSSVEKRYTEAENPHGDFNLEHNAPEKSTGTNSNSRASVNTEYSASGNQTFFDESIARRTPEVCRALESLDIAGIHVVSESFAPQILPIASFKKSFFVFGEAGVGIILGSKPDFEAGWKLKAGAGIGYQLSPKVQITMAGGYLYQNGGFDFQRLSSVNQPGFGTRSSFNTLTPDKLHFTYGKLGAQIRSRRHVFASHAGMQYLYGAQGNITTIVNDQFAAGTVELNRYAWLKTNGLRKLNWTADLSYGYQITPHLSITAGAEYYFSSFTVEDSSLEMEGFTWSGAYSPIQPFIHVNYLLYGRL